MHGLRASFTRREREVSDCHAISTSHKMSTELEKGRSLALALAPLLMSELLHDEAFC